MKKTFTDQMAENILASGRDKKGAKELAEEISKIQENWLNMSGLTKETLLEYRNVDKAKIIEEERAGFLGIGFSYVNDGEKVLLGAPLVAHDLKDRRLFYEDSFLLLTSIANILDKENQKNPMNGGFGEGHFTRVVTRFFEKKLPQE